MYEGIFDDVEHVKEVLASHGHNSVDETLVFELLEDLKVTDLVVKVLLGTRLKSSSNSPDISWSPNRSIQESPKTGGTRISDSLYLSDVVEDSNSSDDLEVLEDNVANAPRRPIPGSEPVDLTMDDNQSTPSPSSSSSEKSNHPETENKAVEGAEQGADSAGALIDLTADTMEVNEGCCPVDNSEDKMPLKVEEPDGNNSTTDSESEMGDYYRRREEESEESEAFGESDDKVSPAVSPALGICGNFDNQGNGEAESIETGDNRMEEMLEENNNDPNNNLEDIEVMEQNNAASSITENLNVEKEETRSPSPKPGCSKDSYYADTDFCMTEDSGAASSGNPKFIVGKRANVANIFEDEDFLVGNCVRLSDTKIGQDVFLIQKILPHFTKAKILSTIMENQEAVNRVEIALWELLPDDKPAPVFHPKRKQAEDNCPAPVKKFLQDELLPKKNPEARQRDEVPKIQETASVPKPGIIKPATFKVLATNKMILTPAKLELSSFKSLAATATVSKSRSPILLKPSKLEHLVTRIPTAPEAKTTNIKPEQPKNISYNTCGKPFGNNVEAAVPGVSRTCAVAKRPTQTAPALPTGLENKPKDSRPSSVNHSAPIDKVKAKTKKVVAENVLQYQVPRQTAAKEKEDSTQSKIHNIGAIPKKQVEVTAAKPAKTLKESRESVITITGTAAEATAQRVSNDLMNNPSQSRNARPQFEQIRHVGNNAAGSVLQKSELKVRLQAMNRAVHRLRANLIAETNDAAKVGKTAAQASGEAASLANPQNAAQQSETNCAQIVQKVGNIKLKTQVLPEKIVPRNPEGPKIEKRLQYPVIQRAAHSQTHSQLQKQHQHPQQKQHHYQLPLLASQMPLQTETPHLASHLQQMGLIAQTANAMAEVQVEQIEPARIEKQDVPPPKELFNPLINMFPDVDPNYIAELCVTAKGRNEGLESLVEVLLINGAIHPRVVNPEPEPQELNPDAQYENLQGIFPDAHPEYLRGIAEKYYNDPEAMKDFVQAKLENPNYPTMADHLKKIKITEQIRQYTVDFSAEKFLQIFPDPWAHFENPKRVHPYNVIAFEFLKCHFRCNKVATIVRAYRSSKHPFHLSLAAKALEIIGPDMKSKRSDKQIPSEDIPLLQEFAFIKHKAEIKEFLYAQKKKEQQEFKRLKENNELIECQCCYDGECMPSKCLTCSEGHVFCKSCIKTGSETKIGEGQTQFGCFVECKGEFTLPVLQKVLEPTMFSILLRKRQEEEVKAAALEGLVSCPFCHFASIPPPEDKVFKCLNPECMKETCRLCKELNHVPLRCDEVIKGEEARHYLEEKMTEALVRKCYRCSRPFFKDEGCNKMTCPCGAMTCYICGQPVKDYKHFNGQGSDRTDLCPLWSDNQVLNAQTVRVVAEAAEKEILKKNPNLNIDAKSLMPSIPRATTGPHQHIANAHVLPVQARRA